MRTLSEAEIRYIFDTYIFPRLQRGELELVPEPGHAPREDYDVPSCAVSHMVNMYERRSGARGPLVARCHCYELPDGTLYAPWQPVTITGGGEGKYDPKRLMHDGRLYRLETRKEREAADAADQEWFERRKRRE